jgi:DNA-directed RNA polymerase specialized sigma24 family protein
MGEGDVSEAGTSTPPPEKFPYASGVTTPQGSQPPYRNETPTPVAQADLEPVERLRRFVVKELGKLGAGDATPDLAGEVIARYLRVRPAVYKPWLERTLRNVLIDYWRRGGRIRLEELPPSSFVSDPAGGAPGRLPPALLASSLSTPLANEDVARRLLDALTPAQRAVVVARFWEDLSGAEIAARFGYKNAAVVDTILDRAERRLRQRFADIDAVR